MKRHARPSKESLIVKAILADRGMFVRDLAVICKCTPGHLYNVLTGAQKSRRIIQIVEEFIDCPLYSDPKNAIRRSKSLRYFLQIPNQEGAAAK